MKIRNCFKAVILGSLALILFAGMFAGMASAAGLAESPYPCVGINPQRTAQSLQTGPEAYNLKWTFSTGGYVDTTPVIDPDGNIYFGSDDDKLYCLYPDGTQKWSFTTGGNVDSSPAIDSNGIVYFGSTDYKFYALYPNGTEKWNYTTPEYNVDGSPTIDGNGYIFFTSSDKVYKLAENGSLMWSHDFGSYQPEENSVTLGTDGTIYVGATQSTTGPGYAKLFALYPNGTEKWNYVMDSLEWSSPAIDQDGIIYIGDYYSRKLRALYPNGTLKWEYTTGGYMGMGIHTDPAIDAGGVIYVGSNDQHLYAINNNGTLKWKYQMKDYVQTSPVIGADGVVYTIDSYGNTLYAMNQDGTVKWSRNVGTTTDGSISIGTDGALYFGGYDKKLHAIGTPAPVASFITSSKTGECPLTVFFQDTSENSPTSWTWDLNGDGFPDRSTQDTSYTYYNPGTYTVTLTATNAAGSSTATAVITPGGGAGPIGGGTPTTPDDGEGIDDGHIPIFPDDGEDAEDDGHIPIFPGDWEEDDIQDIIDEILEGEEITVTVIELIEMSKQQIAALPIDEEAKQELLDLKQSMESPSHWNFWSLLLIFGALLVLKEYLAKPWKRDGNILALGFSMCVISLWKYGFFSMA